MATQTIPLFRGSYVAYVLLVCLLFTTACGVPDNSVAPSSLTPTSVAYVRVALGQAGEPMVETPTTTLVPAQTFTPTSTYEPTPSNGVHILGNVRLQPHYAERQTIHKPASYIVLLDVSGSMSFNIAGEGTIGGKIQFEDDTVGGVDYRCEASSTTTLPYNDQCNGGYDAPWRKVQERRIYQAKNFIYQLIDAMQPDDVMRVLAFGSGMNAQNYVLLPGTGWSGDHALLKETVYQAGAYQGDAYRTNAGSANAQAIQGARQLLRTAPMQASDGYLYSTTVLLLADGPANVFLDGTNNLARDICADISANQARNTLRCQVGTTTSGVLRPVSAMIEQAMLLKQDYPLTLIVAASLAPWETGMSQVVSNPSNLFFGVSNDVLSTLFRPEEATCTPRVSSSWVNRIDAAHAPAPLPNLALPPDTFGYITLFSADGTQQLAQAAISHNQITGRLFYEFAHVPPGNYLLRAVLAYKGDDSITRIYDWISLNGNSQQFSAEIVIPIHADNSSDLILPVLSTTLQPQINVCT